MANEDRRRAWLKELDDAVQAILAERRARDNLYIFQQWAARMFQTLGIGRSDEGRNPPRWLRTEADFDFVMGRLGDLRIAVSDATKVSFLMLPLVYALSLIDQIFVCSLYCRLFLVKTIERTDVLVETDLNLELMDDAQHKAARKQRLCCFASTRRLEYNKN